MLTLHNKLALLAHVATKQAFIASLLYIYKCVLHIENTHILSAVKRWFHGLPSW